MTDRADDDGPTPFGRLLRRRRTRRNVTQERLAYGADLSPRHVSFLETGRSNPSRESVLARARALDLPLRDRNALLRAAGSAPVYPDRDPLEEEIALAPDDRTLEALRRELEEMGTVPEASPGLPEGKEPPALPVHLRKDGRDLRLLSFLVTVAAPREVGLQEIRMETLLPADEAGEALMRELSQS